MRIAKFDRFDLLNNLNSDGVAFTIWFAGCTRKCPECHNPELWDNSIGDDYSPNDIICDLAKSSIDYRDVVLLGGEPLEQNEDELYMLLHSLHSYGYHVWLYTGNEFDKIPEYILEFLYKIKTGEYNKSLKSDGVLASSNQKFWVKTTDNIWIQEEIKC